MEGFFKLSHNIFKKVGKYRTNEALRQFVADFRRHELP